MCPPKLFIFDEFGGISTQLKRHVEDETRCADSVVRGYHLYIDKWDPEIGVGHKFNAQIKVSNRCDRYAVNNRYAVKRHDRYAVNDRYAINNPRCRN